MVKLQPLRHLGLRHRQPLTHYRRAVAVPATQAPLQFLHRAEQPAGHRIQGSDCRSPGDHTLVGDHFQAATLLGVDRIRDPRDATGAGFRVVAVLCNGGQKEYIDSEGGDGAGASAPAYAPPPPDLQGGSPDLSGVKRLTDNRYEIPKKVLDQSLSNLNNLATQARIVPSFKNGVANGFKLFSIQPGSLYSSIGVENGDVIQRINGYEINSPDKALEIYQKLKDAGHITIDIERNGQTLRKDYNVTP